MIKIFKRLFPKPKEEKDSLDELKINLVRRYARGNVRLKQGKFTTKAEADKKKAEALKYHL